MVLAKDIEDGFDLDRIDTEMKMEKIRQSASKLTWDGFGQALRRNLMEKRLVCDAESRMDILQAISTMRRSLPVDEKSDLQTKLKQLADSLECNFTTQPGLIFMRNAELLLEFLCDGENISSCKIGYFGRLPMDSDYMRNLIKQGDFITLRTSIYAMLATVPNSLNGTEKMACVTALDILEVFLANQSGAPTFEKINTMPWGWLYPRDSLRPARIYYVAEPSYIINSGRTHVDAGNDFDELPYMELSVVHCEKETQLPTGSNINSEPWSSTRPIFACFCLRFSVPMLFSYSTWKKMEQYLVKSSVVKHHINLYRYMSNYNFEEPELTLRTNLPAKYPQHCYSISADILKEERDCIISELNIRSAADISKIISLVRAQAIHNSLWESFLSMCCGRWKGGETIKMRVVPSSTCYEVCFTAVDRVVVARFEMTKDLNWVAAVEGSDGQPLTTSLNADITARINKTRSIPVSLVCILRTLNCRGSPDPADPTSDTLPCVSTHLDKVGDAWLPRQTQSRPVDQINFNFEVHPVLDATPGGLLASFKEIDDGPRVPSFTRAEARTQRVQSDTALAISDLEAICQLGESMDDDSKTSTPALARHSASPAPSIRPGGLPQLSPLESARLKMAHSVGAAAAVGLASASDVFDFSDERSGGSGSTFPSPSPQYTPFGYPSGSPMGQGQTVRGTTVKRRSRARKVANQGDRMPDHSLTSHDGTLSGIDGRKTRGKSSVRRPRGSRKSSALPISHSNLDQQRPMLQRSFSDFAHMTTFSTTPESPYVDTESDDECDPPPPPKSLMAGFPIGPSPCASGAVSGSSLTMFSMANSPAQVMSPSIYTPSSSVAMPSPLAQSPSLNQPVSSPSSRVQPQRKSSLEMVVGKLKTSSMPQPQRKIEYSDLYDDGTDSPPPQEGRISQPVQSNSLNFGASPVLTNVVSQMTTLSRLPGSPKESLNEMPISSVPTPTIKSECSKLILKIPKLPSRSSPSVDAQKAKSVPMQSMPKLERQEKKKDKEKKEVKDKEKFKASEERRKRKAEGSKEKEREHKRHKSSSTTTLDSFMPSSSKATPPSPVPMPFGLGSLKNFKIPKREITEDSKESPREKEPLTPITPTPIPTPIPSLGSVAPKSILKKNSTTGAPPPLPHGAPRPPFSMGGPRKPPPLPDHRDRRPSMAGVPPFRGNTSSIPLPKGPPPPQATPSHGGTWIRPPSHLPPNCLRSPSPDPNAMQIDEDTNSPEDSLRIADD